MDPSPPRPYVGRMDDRRMQRRDWGFTALACAPILLVFVIPIAQTAAGTKTITDGKIAMLYAGLVLGLALLPVGLVLSRRAVGTRRRVLLAATAIALLPVALLVAAVAFQWAMVFVNALLS